MAHRIRTLAPLALLPLLLGATPAPPGFGITTVDLPGAPQRLAAADLDGDGDTDLLVLSVGHAACWLTVLESGPAGFAPAWSATLAPPLTQDPPDLDLADLDADGDPDLVVNIPYVLRQSRLNAGDGTFGAAIALTGTGPRVQNTLGLIDGDALVDLAAYDISSLGRVGGYKGLGTGNFTLLADELVGGTDFATRAELADVTGDGLQDLVRASKAGVEYTPGVDFPGFPAWGANTVVWSDPAADLALADLDGDAQLDAVVSIPQSDAIEVFHGLPGGGLGGPSPFPGGHQPDVLAVADMDNDGLLDVIIGSQGTGRVSINTNSGGGVFLDLAAYRGGWGITDVIAADLDADGDVDLAVTSELGRVALLHSQLVP